MRVRGNSLKVSMYIAKSKRWTSTMMEVNLLLRVLMEWREFGIGQSNANTERKKSNGCFNCLMENLLLMSLFILMGPVLLQRVGQSLDYGSSLNKYVCIKYVMMHRLIKCSGVPMVIGLRHVVTMGLPVSGI